MLAKIYIEYLAHVPAPDVLLQPALSQAERLRPLGGGLHLAPPPVTKHSVASDPLLPIGPIAEHAVAAETAAGAEEESA